MRKLFKNRPEGDEERIPMMNTLNYLKYEATNS